MHKAVRQIRTIHADLESKIAKKKFIDKGKVSGRCRMLDVYGKPVRFFYKGSDAYRTKIGATVSIIAALAVISFGLLSWLSRSDQDDIVQQVVH